MWEGKAEEAEQGEKGVTIQNGDDGEDDNDFGDDFDDFAEGEEGNDDDFGDFDDGFKEDTTEQLPPQAQASAPVPDILAGLVSSSSNHHILPRASRTSLQSNGKLTCHSSHT